MTVACFHIIEEDIAFNSLFLKTTNVLFIRHVYCVVLSIKPTSLSRTITLRLNDPNLAQAKDTQNVRRSR